jgi:hypothetical protein
MSTLSGQAAGRLSRHVRSVVAGAGVITQFLGRVAAFLGGARDAQHLAALQFDNLPHH